jgi:D-amino-acid dehydrogenase
MSKDGHIIVIGGGVIGICTAYYLWTAGRQVTVVEQGEVGSGCSFANAGYVCPSHFIPLASPGMLARGLRWMLNPESPFYVKPRCNADVLTWLWKFRSACNENRATRAMPLLRDMNLESVALFKELSSMPGLDFGFRPNGLLMLYNSAEGEHEETGMAKKATRLGVEARLMSKDEINHLDPGLQVTARGGVYYPGDGHMDPARFVQGLGLFLQQQGVKVCPFTEVLGLERHEGRITGVRTTQGNLAADEFVLAGGSWSPGIVRPLGISIPVQPAKGYSVTTDSPPRKMSIPSILTEARVAVTPLGDSLRFAGTLELAGLDLSINMRRVHAILNAVPRYLADFNPRDYMNIKPWAGLRPCSPDGLPYVGRFRSCENLIAATGHAMLGLSLAPVTGKLVAEIVEGKTPSIHLTLLDPDRYNGKTGSRSMRGRPVTQR